MFSSAEGQENLPNFCSVQQARHQIMGDWIIPFFLISFLCFFIILLLLYIYRIVSNRLNAAAADLIVTSVKFILLSSV